MELRESKHWRFSQKKIRHLAKKTLKSLNTTFFSQINNSSSAQILGGRGLFVVSQMTFPSTFETGFFYSFQDFWPHSKFLRNLASKEISWGFYLLQGVGGREASEVGFPPPCLVNCFGKFLFFFRSRKKKQNVRAKCFLTFVLESRKFF